MIFPYLQLPTCIGYGEGDDEKVVVGKYQPVKISAYHDGFNGAGIFIYIEGQPIQIALTIEQFEAQLTGYWKKVNSKPNLNIVK